MKEIPLHDLQPVRPAMEFEISLWKKKKSKYDFSLPHRHNYYELLIFLKDGGKHEIDFTEYPIRSGSLHFVAPGQVHVVARSVGSEGFSILFSDVFAGGNFNLNEFRFFRKDACPVLNLAGKDFTILKILTEELKHEFFSQQSNKREMLQLQLKMLLIHCQRFYEKNQFVVSKKLPVKNAMAVQLENLIENNFHLHWRAGEYARQLHTTIAQLNSFCRLHFSKSTEQLIQTRILLEIKRKLVYSEKTVKEICYELNFDDPAYFNRFFKKHTGITPLEYRKSVRQ